MWMRSPLSKIDPVTIVSSWDDADIQRHEKSGHQQEEIPAYRVRGKASGVIFIPRNKRLRAILGGCAALSAVMVGPIIVDASAQATPQSSCVSGGVCLTSAASTTVTVPVTTTETTTVPVTTTKTVPVTTTTTVPVTTTKTVPVTTTKTTTQTATVTVPVTTTTTATTTKNFTTTRTVFRRTTTVTTTVPGSGTGTTTTTLLGGPNARRGADWRATTSTGTSGQCTPPGQTSSIGSGQIETCGPMTGRVKVYPTAAGLYTTIFDNDSTYYVSIGIFAPQYRHGSLSGCYYAPDASSVTSPGRTTTVANGVLADAVAFGLNSSDVSSPRAVSISDCS
jgi:hypothetical protein